MVGLFVLVATGLLIFTLFYLTGLFDHGQPTYRTYLKNAGGLAPGSDVRYAGGPPIGHVAEVHSDPNDVTRIEVLFRVHSDIPVKTDSRLKIASIGALGDNYLGIIPGTQDAPRAPSGYVLPAAPYSGFDELSDKLSAMAPQASALLQNLNARVIELQSTIARVNDLIGDQNRANVPRALRISMECSLKIAPRSVPLWGISTNPAPNSLPCSMILKRPPLRPTTPFHIWMRPLARTVPTFARQLFS
jgi:phospholipid/cholesterol/gamma-HCH transport system substrate-binding protein